MSADNAIFVQKRLDNKWWVWMDFMSNDGPPDPVGKSSAIWFSYEDHAKRHAARWMSREPIVEYGVIHLAPQTSEVTGDDMGNKKLIKKYVEEARRNLEAAYELQQDTEELSGDQCPFYTDDHGYGSWTLASHILNVGAKNCPFCDAEFPIVWGLDEPLEDDDIEPPDLWEIADSIETDLSIGHDL